MKKLCIGIMLLVFSSLSLADDNATENTSSGDADTAVQKSWNLALGLNLLHSWNVLDLDKKGLNLEDLSKDDIRGLGLELYFLIEHAIPVLPNFKFQYTGLKTSKNGDVRLIDKAKEDLGTLIKLDANNELSSESYIDYSHLDATLYYRLVPKTSYVQFDLGLTVRYFIHPLNSFSVKAEAKDLLESYTGENEDSLIYSLIPLIYVDLTGDILDTGLSLTAAGNFMVIGKNKYINDWKFSAKYLIPYIHLGVELGYRYLGIKADKNALETIKTDNHMLYTGLYISF